MATLFLGQLEQQLVTQEQLDSFLLHGLPEARGPLANNRGIQPADTFAPLVCVEAAFAHKMLGVLNRLRIAEATLSVLHRDAMVATDDSH